MKTSAAAMKRPASPAPAPAPASPQDTAPAFAHFFAHRSMVRAYIYALSHDATVVDDVLSDVAVEVARCWEAYDRSLPFGPWVRGVARRLTLKRMSFRQRREVGLPEDVLESLGTAMDQIADESGLEEQKARLRTCVDRLPPHTRELVRLRYFEERRLDDIAAQVGRTMGALYTAYSRIHAALLRCMESAGEGAS